MKQELENILKEIPASLASDKRIQKKVIHNLKYFLQIQSSFQICKENFYDFDFRDDYWWKPEIRILGKYYIDYFKDDFYPPDELRNVLFKAFSLVKTARLKGLLDFAPSEDAHLKKDILKKIGEVLAQFIRNNSFDSPSLREAHARSFKGFSSVSEHMAQYLEKFYLKNRPEDMNGSLVNRIQFLPYYVAKNKDDLQSAIFFFCAFYTLFTATNSYQTGAQKFAPILGNNSTKLFLDYVEKWINGESITKTGFRVLNSELREPQDRSEYVAILEVHGFCRLNAVPYVNKVVMENYRSLFELGDVEGKVVQERVGAVIREFLVQNNQVVKTLASTWDSLLGKAKSSFSLHYEPEKIKNTKQKELYESQLMNATLLKEYQDKIISVGKNYTDIEKAQVLIHLSLDANSYLKNDHKSGSGELPFEAEKKVRYWSISAGEGAKYWDQWQKKKLIALGWNEMGDLSQFPSKKSIKDQYNNTYNPKTDNPKNDSLALFEFRHSLKKDDIVFIKDGRWKMLGVARVTSDYQFEPSEPYSHIRKVEWLRIGDWNINEVGKFARKTLTNITENSDFVEGLLKITGLDTPASTEGAMTKINSLPTHKNTIFWGPPGTGKTYKLLQLQNSFKDYSSNTDEMISWIQELSWWEVIASALIDIKQPVSVPELLKHEFIQAKVKLQANKTPKNTIWGILQSHTVISSKTVNVEKRQEPLVVDKLEDSRWALVGEWEGMLGDLVDGVTRIRSGEKRTPTERYKVVTFHQSYSYEEFVEGIRPERLSDGSGISYQVKDGVFKLLCQRALENPTKNYAIFIDEINRGNISKIFGELITLIEEDKRLGAPNEVTVTLPYSGDKFGVPNNLYVIGTMNSVDRSIALVDMALRRRFNFESIRPDAQLVPETNFGFNLRKIFENLNNKIAVILGTEYQLGHSYFMGTRVTSIEAFKHTWFGSILPLLQEYLFDDWEKIEALVGGFVTKTEVKELEKFSLASITFGSFEPSSMSNEKFIELMKALE